jgi:Methyltransferase domain
MHIKKIIKQVLILIFGYRLLNATLFKTLYLARFAKWCKHHPVRLDAERKGMHSRVMSHIGAGEPVQYLEFGVYQGESITWWCEQMNNPHSEFVGFDSFEGLPEEWEGEKNKGYFTTDGKVPNIADPRCSFQVGLFQDTLMEFLARISLEKRKVLHLDADLFSSTIYVLVILAPLIRPGDIIIFDEFHVYLDEFRAFEASLSLLAGNYSVIAAMAGFDYIGYSRVAIEFH